MIVCSGEALIDMVPDGNRLRCLSRASGRLSLQHLHRRRPSRRQGLVPGAAGHGFSRLAALRKARGQRRRRLRPWSVAGRAPPSPSCRAVPRGTRATPSIRRTPPTAVSPCEDLPARLPPEARFLMLGSITMLQEPIATTVERLAARERENLLVSFDPNIRPSLIRDRDSYLARFERWASMSAIVKISSDDLEWLYPGLSFEAGVDRLRALGAEPRRRHTGARRRHGEERPSRSPRPGLPGPGGRHHRRGRHLPRRPPGPPRKRKDMDQKGSRGNRRTQARRDSPFRQRRGRRQLHAHGRRAAERSRDPRLPVPTRT